MPKRLPDFVSRNAESIRFWRQENTDEVKRIRIQMLETLYQSCGRNKREVSRLLRSGVVSCSGAHMVKRMLEGDSDISLLLAGHISSLNKMAAEGVNLAVVVFTPEGSAVNSLSRKSIGDVGIREEVEDALNKGGVQTLADLMSLSALELDACLEGHSGLADEVRKTVGWALK